MEAGPAEIMINSWQGESSLFRVQLLTKMWIVPGHAPGSGSCNDAWNTADVAVLQEAMTLSPQGFESRLAKGPWPAAIATQPFPAFTTCLPPDEKESSQNLPNRIQ